MRKSELKNLLRRRTADKLYDRARSAGRVPAQLPASQLAAIESAPKSPRAVKGKQPADRNRANEKLSHNRSSA